MALHGHGVEHGWRLRSLVIEVSNGSETWKWITEKRPGEAFVSAICPGGRHPPARCLSAGRSTLGLSGSIALTTCFSGDTSHLCRIPDHVHLQRPRRESSTYRFAFLLSVLSPGTALRLPAATPKDDLVQALRMYRQGSGGLVRVEQDVR